jgi:hypothetical protein
MQQIGDRQRKVAIHSARLLNTRFNGVSDGLGNAELQSLFDNYILKRTHLRESYNNQESG